jgi:hypothetical protein
MKFWFTFENFILYLIIQCRLLSMSDITYTWKVNSVKCYKDINGYQDYVYQTYWNCAAATSGTAGAYDASFAGATPLGTGAASTSGYAFKPFADLTQDDVLNWIWATLPPNAGKEYYEQKVSGELVYKMNYKTEEPNLPWNPAPSGTV